MVYFLNSKVKIHAEDPLQYIFDENKEKIVVLGYSIVSRRSPPLVASQGKVSYLVDGLLSTWLPSLDHLLLTASVCSHGLQCIKPKQFGKLIFLLLDGYIRYIMLYSLCIYPISVDFKS